MAMKVTHMNSTVIRFHIGFNHIGFNVPFNNGKDQPCHIKYCYQTNSWCIIRNSSVECVYKWFACFKQLGIVASFFLSCGQLGLDSDDCIRWCQQFNVFIIGLTPSEQRIQIQFSENFQKQFKLSPWWTKFNWSSCIIWLNF